MSIFKQKLNWILVTNRTRYRGLYNEIQVNLAIYLVQERTLQLFTDIQGKLTEDTGMFLQRLKFEDPLNDTSFYFSGLYDRDLINQRNEALFR